MSAKRDWYQDLMGEAERLLQSLPVPVSSELFVRIRLARDELATKVLKLESTEAAERAATRELSDATERLLRELEGARKAVAEDSKPEGNNPP